MNRDVASLAKENEALRNLVRDLQAGRRIEPAEALAMIATAFDERDKALHDAARLTSVLVAELAMAKSLALVGNGAPAEYKVDLDNDQLLALDGCSLRIERNEAGHWLLTVRPPERRVSLAGPNGA